MGNQVTLGLKREMRKHLPCNNDKIIMSESGKTAKGELRGKN